MSSDIFLISFLIYLYIVFVYLILVNKKRNNKGG